MRDPVNIKDLVELRPDYIGFILFPGSNRFIGNNYTLSVDIPASIQRVGVFVDEQLMKVKEWIEILGLDFVQLHGSETPEYCLKLKNLGIHVIKSFSIDNTFDFSTAKNYLACSDFFLFDTKTSLHGGSGKQFDWFMLKKYTFDKPFFISGGIGPTDKLAIMQLANPALHGIDINSKFESSLALKDIPLLQRFINELRSE